MSRKKKTEEIETLETPEVIDETPEETEKTEETPEENAQETSETEPVAYIGPGIKHVTASGRVYKNGLPAELEKKIEEIPAIKGLLVPVSKLAESSKLARTPDTALYNLYRTVKEKL